MTLGVKWQPWTPEEDTRLWALVRAAQATGGKFDWHAIAAQMPNRNPDACKQHYFLLKRKEEGRPERKPYAERERRTRAEIVEARQAPIPETKWPRHASLTAAICGDPLPGRSALDEKRQALRA